MAWAVSATILSTVSLLHLYIIAPPTIAPATTTGVVAAANAVVAAKTVALAALETAKIAAAFK